VVFGADTPHEPSLLQRSDRSTHRRFVNADQIDDASWWGSRLYREHRHHSPFHQ
jgi:hypothetical protein